MSVTAWLTGHQVPLVVIDAAGLTVGAPYILTASAPGVDAWTVATGTVTAASMLWADSRAPLGVQATYVLDTPNGGVTALTRQGPGPSRLVLSAPDGRPQVVARNRAIGDPRHHDVRSYGYPVTGRRHDVSQWDAAAGAPDVAVSVWVEPHDLATAEAVLLRRGPVLLLTGGPVPGIDPVQVVRIDDVNDALVTPWGARQYDIVARAVQWPSRPGGPLPVPVATWGEAAALGWAWGNAGAMSWSAVAGAVAQGLTPAQAGA